MIFFPVTMESFQRVSSEVRSIWETEMEALKDPKLFPHALISPQAWD